MDLRMAGQITVITGASKGIGLAVSKALVSARVRVRSPLREPSPTSSHSSPAKVRSTSSR